jgi:hypothetical protein
MDIKDPKCTMIIDSGFKPTMIIDSGFKPTMIIDSGFKPTMIIDSGFKPAKVKQPPLDPDEVSKPIFNRGAPYRCPICHGKGLVPNNFYLELASFSAGGHYTTTSTMPERCRACSGTGVIWG